MIHIAEIFDFTKGAGPRKANKIAIFADIKFFYFASYMKTKRSKNKVIPC